MQEPEHWKETKLSLERPYKNDQGKLIPTLLDITPEGELVYEPKESTAKLLGDNLRRIFSERGVDFFEKNSTDFLESGVLSAEPLDKEPQEAEPVTKDEESDVDETEVEAMTVEELYKMKMEILPQLYIAHGEMSHARDLLSLILSSDRPSSASVNLISAQSQPEPLKTSPNTLSATVVTKPPPIIPLQAFNAQLAIGGKDEALRKAANLFKVAAERMEKGRVRSEHYWVDALKIRRANWSLIPAPLPFGAPTGKGADKTTKDFVISYGLEESPPSFRRRAVAQMSYTGHEKNALIFPHRQNTRLCISVASPKADGSRSYASNTYARQINETDLNDILRTAQLEVIEQEIYAQIAKEAGSLPTAAARVSERLILIDAAQNTELKFELIDTEETATSQQDKDPLSQAKCDFIYHYLLALLLRRHTYHKRRRLGIVGSPQPIGGMDQQAPLVLQPVIDILQYQVFCRRIRSELDDVCSALNRTGICTTLRFSAVEEIGKELVRFVSDATNRGIGGEATLRVDDRYTMRLTMLSPSSLTVHLSQANISILSIPELTKLLCDEVEKLVLERICSLGRQICNDVGGIWFVDMNRCVGRWDGGAINFHVVIGERYKLTCVASRFGRRIASKDATVETYDNSSTVSVVAWAQDVIRRSLIDG